MAGTAAVAWRVPLERMQAFARQHPDRVDPATVETTLDMWYVNGQAFHPFWSWWLVGIVSLRDMEGAPPPNRHYPGAEYELSCWTLNDRVMNEMPVNGEGGFRLTENRPPELLLQFHGLAPLDAREIAQFFVEAICAGRSHPAQEWGWDVKNREALTRLVNAYYTGRHGSGPAREKRLEVDPYTGLFTGEEEPWLQA